MPIEIEEPKFHIRYSVTPSIVGFTAKELVQGEGAAMHGLVVGSIAYPEAGGMAQQVTIYGAHPKTGPLTSKDLFTFWLNLATQLGRLEDLDETRRTIALETAQSIHTFFHKAATEAAKKTIITKG